MARGVLRLRCPSALDHRTWAQALLSAWNERLQASYARKRVRLSGSEEWQTNRFGMKCAATTSCGLGCAQVRFYAGGKFLLAPLAIPCETAFSTAPSVTPFFTAFRTASQTF